MKQWRPDEWQLVSNWFDEAMTLDAERRHEWITRLQADEDEGRRPLVEELGRLLAAAGEIETGSFLTALPKLERHTGSDFGLGQIIGPYRLEEQIGQGGMAEVWRAVPADGQWQRTVALKLPYLHQQAPGRRPAWEKRFERERDILAALRHPNVAALLDAGVTDKGVAWLALEYVRGEPITGHCDRQRLDLRRRLLLFRQVLHAIQHAHAHLIIHRDLKPANILVTADGEVRLLDFGIAKLLVDDQESTQDTELTLLAGRPLTPAYASPEQVLGHPLTTASDTYSLVVLFYELVCGELPYELHHASTVELERAIIETEPRLPSRRNLDDDHAGMRGVTPRALRRLLTPELDAIALRALAKSPEGRYPSVDAMAADIDRWLNGEAVLARPPGKWLMARKFVSRHRFSVAAATAATAALLVLTTVAVIQRGQAQREAARAVAARDFLFEMFRLADPDQSRGAALTAGELLEASRKRAMEGIADQPQLQAELLAAIGDAQNKIGQGSQAEETLSRAAEIFEQLGDRRQRALTEIVAVENAQHMLDIRSAKRWLQSAEADAAAKVNDHEVQARLLTVRGWVLTSDGEAQRAETELEQAVAQATLARGADDERTIFALSKLAEAQESGKHYDAALASLDEGVRRIERNGKLTAIQRADIDVLRAFTALDAGNYASAKSQAVEAVDRCRAALGSNGLLCHSLQRLQLMAALRVGAVAEAADLATALLPDLDGSASVAKKLRLVIHVSRALAAADGLSRHPALRQRLSEGAQAGEEMPPSLRQLARLALAEIALRENRPKDARQLADDILTVGAAQASDTYILARAQMLAGLASQHRQRHAEALEALAKAEKLFEQAFSARHADTLLCRLNKVESLVALGRREEALALIDDVLPELRRALGEISPVIRNIQSWRAGLAAARPVTFRPASTGDFFI